MYSCGFKLKISILSSSTHPQLTHQHHPPTHNSLKLVEGWFLLSFSSQTKQKLFSISNFQFSKFQNSWRLEILSKLPLFELDSKVALTRIHSIHWKLNDCDGVVGMTKIGMKKIVMMKEWGEWVHHRWIGSAAWLLEFAIVYLYQNFHYSPLWRVRMNQVISSQWLLHNSCLYAWLHFYFKQSIQNLVCLPVVSDEILAKNGEHENILFLYLCYLRVGWWIS